MGMAMKGQFVCHTHCGVSKRSREAGKQRLAMAEVQSMSARIVAYNDDFAERPAEGLLREVKWSAQIAIALGKICEGLQDEQLMSYSVGTGRQLNVFQKAWTEERLNHARLCKLALDAGIAQQQLNMIEEQAGRVVTAMISLLSDPDLHLSAEQIIQGRVVAAKVLRRLNE
jgi:hypothetical protein